MAKLTVATCQFPVSNSSARESMWPAFFVRADGMTTGRLRRNVPGVLVTEIDTDEDLYDSTASWRDRALRGRFHSGDLADDPRSADRSSFSYRPSSAVGQRGPRVGAM